MIHLVTFASDDYRISANVCMESAKRCGVDQAHLIISVESSNERGYGFWKWKPRAILAVMNGDDFALPLRDGDILIYSDAGVEFLEPVQTVIDLMDQDIWLFGNEHLHAKWCKRDIIEAVWPLVGHYETPPAHAFWSRFGKQAQASVIFFRVNDYTRKFVKEWLHWCLYGVQTYMEVDGYKIPKATHYLIDDSPSVAPNHPEFIENRHDQAILTTMAYRDGIKLHEWFVKYEGYTPGRMTGYPRELERPFVFHHRRRNSEWEGIAA